MAVEARSLLLKLAADVAQFKTDMNDAANATERAVNKMTSKISQVKDALVGIAEVAAFSEVVKAAADAERATALLEATLVSTHDAAGLTNAQLEDLANNLTKTSAFSKTAVTGAEALLAGFTKLRGEGFEKAAQASVDLAAKMGIGLNQAALAVGRALQDPIKGTQALRREGIAFSASQQAMIKSLVDTGQTAKAQDVILQQLATSAGGSAKAIRDTIGGAFDSMKNSIDEMFAQIGKTQSDGLQGAFNAVGKAADFIAENGKLASNAILGMAAAAVVFEGAQLPAVLEGVVAAAVKLAPILATPQGAFLATLAAGVDLLVTFKDAEFQVGNQTVTVQNLFVAAWEKIGGAISATISLGQSILTEFFMYMKLNVQEFAQDLSSVLNFVAGAFQQINNFLHLLARDPAAPAWFKSMVTGADNAIASIKQFAQVQADTIKNLATSTSHALDPIFQRAAQLTALKNQKKPAAAGLGVAAPDDDTSAAMAKKAKQWKDFIAQQQLLNDAIKLELNNEKALIPYEQARAQIMKQIGTLTTQQEATLKQIFQERQNLNTSKSLKDELDTLTEQNAELDLQLQHRQAEVPIQQFLNKLAKDGVDLSKLDADQQAKLVDIKQQILQTEQKRQQIALNNAVQSANDEIKKLQDEVTLGKEQAGIEDQIRRFKEQNRLLDDDALESLRKSLQLKSAQNLNNDVEAYSQEVAKLQEQVEEQKLINLHLNDQAIAKAKIFELEQKYHRELTDEQNAEVRKLADEQAQTEEARKALDIIQQTRTAQQKWADDLIDLNKMLHDGVLTQEQWSRAVQQMSPQFQKLKSAADSIGQAFTNAFDNAIFSGQKFSQVLKQLALDIAKIVVEQAITQPLGNAISKGIMKLFNPSAPGSTTSTGGSTGGSNTPFGAITGNAGKLLGSAFSGLKKLGNMLGFASGGRPPLGQVSVVGEQGPELFVPDSAGTVLPNDIFSGIVRNLFGGGLANIFGLAGLFNGGSNGGSRGVASTFNNAANTGNVTANSSNSDLANALANKAGQQAQQAQAMGLGLSAQGFLANQKMWQYYGGMGVTGTGFGQAPQIIGTPNELSWLNGTMSSMPAGFFAGIRPGAIQTDGIPSSVSGYDVGQDHYTPTGADLGIPQFQPLTSGPLVQNWNGGPSAAGGAIAMDDPTELIQAYVPGMIGMGIGMTSMWGSTGGFGSAADPTVYNFDAFNGGSDRAAVNDMINQKYGNAVPMSYDGGSSSPASARGSNQNDFGTMPDGATSYVGAPSPFTISDASSHYWAPGAFAAGGRPPIGRPSIVGEKGAELFVPDTAGTIVPNNKLMVAGNQPTVNIDIHNPAGLPIQQSETTGSDGSRNIQYVIAETMAKDMRENGPIYQALAKGLGVRRQAFVR